MNAESTIKASDNVEIPDVLKRNDGKEIVQTSEDVGSEILAKDKAAQ